MEIPAGCLDPEVLAAYREGALPASEHEAVQAHAAACPACRQVLRFLAGRRVAPRRTAWRWAAAAALLIAVSGWGLLRGEAPVSPPPSAPPRVAALPEGALDRTAYLVPGLDLVLDAGARVQAEGRRLRLDSGRIWLDVAEPATLEVQGKLLEIRDAAVAARVAAAPKSAWLFREALAGEEILAEIWVLRGKAAGRKLRLVSGTWQEGRSTAQEIMALDQARALALASLPGREAPAAGLQDSFRPWRWVTVLADRQATTELGLRFAVAGDWYRWIAGTATMPPKPREIVELAWDGTWLTGRVDGIPVFSEARGNLKSVLRAEKDASWGLSAWGGRVTVAKSTFVQEAQP